MKNFTLAKWGATHALGVLVYIFLVAVFMNNANSWLGVEDNDIFSPIAFLLLFMFSALVTGGLVLGKPIMLYLDGQKKDGVKLFFYTSASLFVIMLIVFAILAILK